MTTVIVVPLHPKIKGLEVKDGNSKKGRDKG